MAELDFESSEALEALEEELAKLDPADLRYLSQLISENPPAVKKIIKNVLDESIPEEIQKRLKPPLQPKPYKPIPPQEKPKGEALTLKEYQRYTINLYHGKRIDGTEERGRRYILWNFFEDLDRDLTPKLMEKIKKNVRTSFYARHIYVYKLRNIEDGTIIVYYKNISSPWIKTYGEVENWLREREENRLDTDNKDRPDTKWVFEGHAQVDLKVVLDRQPLMGTGPLPDWLRNLARGNHAMVTLDTYRDNMCLWRCIAVHRGARPDRSTKAAQGLAKSFFELRNTPTNCAKTSLDELEKVEMHLNKGSAFSGWLGIRVYVPERVGTEVVWHLTRNPASQFKNVMTIGIFGEHAFLIKDITKLAKTYECIHCHARFTRSDSLQRHAERCAQGKTVIDCPGEKVEAPQTAYEKAFYPKHQASKESIQWLEYVAKHWKITIHHAMSGHGGERWIEKSPVDGYNHKTKTVFQYHGCHWHGCPKCHHDRDKIIERGDKTREDLYQATKRRTAHLRKEGYGVIECWSCEVGEKYEEQLPQTQTKSYPHAIFV